ncbi:hypothetical protein C1Y40_01772 [Mycobacterium talmoniae]|uniref:Uncharacterized protein n=1 Tax=Mycobacterium talmoniae TaxID=1858794 RepID=A0A2S8BMV5_9MYCO|nr:hypothetical protein C1Y40_01772 [Mycobacterium talmoniae]
MSIRDALNGTHNDAAHLFSGCEPGDQAPTASMHAQRAY